MKGTGPRVKISIIFSDCHLIPLVFIAFFLNVLRRRSWGVPFGELEKIFSLMQYKKKLIISGGPVFLLKRSSLGTSDIQTCYSPKGITYIIYTLMYERHQVPFRTTYIEYRSPVNIFINFIGFHCKNMFFVIVPRHRSSGIPFGELEKLIFFMQYKK